MMNEITQSLTIENFLGVTARDIEIGKLTALIGPQASGKSVTARLLFFFREYLNGMFRNGVVTFEHKSSYDRKQREQFCELFPAYSWEKDAFKVIYRVGDFEVVAESGKNSSSLRLGTSKNISDEFRVLKSEFKKFQNAEEANAKSEKRLPRASFGNFIRRRERSNEGLPLHYNSLFVPAARSFYAHLRRGLLSILSIDKTMDQVILQFAEFYEYAKDTDRRLFHPRGRALEDSEEYFRDIVRGTLFQQDEVDFIRMKNRIIEVRKASSGQQEALPLLVSLARYPEYTRDGVLIIEEPEAHLFPSAQKRIMDFFVQQLTRYELSIVFTTHSPYLLACLNNMILRNKASEESGISFDDVRAYYLDGDNLIDLRMKELSIIDSAGLDQVSGEIAEEFEKLLETFDE